MPQANTKRALLLAAAVAAIPGAAAAQDATSYVPDPGSAPTSGGEGSSEDGRESLSDSMSYGGGAAVRAEQAAKAERVRKGFKVPKAGEAQIVHEVREAGTVMNTDAQNLKVWDPEAERYVRVEATPDFAFDAKNTPQEGRMPNGWCRFEKNANGENIDGDDMGDQARVPSTTFGVDVISYTGFHFVATSANDTDGAWNTAVTGSLVTQEDFINTTVVDAAGCFTHVETKRATYTDWEVETDTKTKTRTLYNTTTIQTNYETTFSTERFTSQQTLTSTSRTTQKTEQTSITVGDGKDAKTKKVDTTFNEETSYDVSTTTSYETVFQTARETDHLTIETVFSRMTLTKTTWDTEYADDDEVTKWDTIKFRSYEDSRDVQQEEEKQAEGRFDRVDGRNPEEERVEGHGTYVDTFDE